MAAALLWPGALAIGLSLGLLGSGGSILTVPVLVYIVGQDEKLAIAGSLAIVGVIALAGSLSYVKQRLIDWRSVWLFGLPGMAGTYLGASASAYVPGTLQLTVFALVMLTAARFMWRPAPEFTLSQTREAWRISVDGVLVGALTGFVGVGGGFLIVPALVVLGGLTMHRAVATSLVIIAMKSAVGFVTYKQVLAASGATLDYGILCVVAALGVTGSLVGAQLAQRLPRSVLQRGFAAVLLTMSTSILVTSLSELMR